MHRVYNVLCTSGCVAMHVDFKLYPCEKVPIFEGWLTAVYMISDTSLCKCCFVSVLRSLLFSCGGTGKS